MERGNSTNPIVGFVQNLFYIPAIENAAARVGYEVIWIENAHTFQPHRRLLDLLSRKQPALLILDLTSPEIPWKEWLAWLTVIPETRQIPVICFGPHVDVQAFNLARSIGAAAVFARSRFLKDLPGILSKYARAAPIEHHSEICKQPISEQAQAGIALFNERKYFEAHEELEAAWMADSGKARELYRGILQVGVAYLQIERGNYRGALKMLFRARQWLHPFPNICRGIDVERVRQDADRVYTELVRIGESQILDLDRALFGKVWFAEQ